MATVTASALIRRINRRLEPDDEAIRQPRGERGRQDLGDFFLLDTNRNLVIEKDVDLEAFSRRIGALHSHEKIAGQ